MNFQYNSLVSDLEKALSTLIGLALGQNCERAAAVLRPKPFEPLAIGDGRR